MIWQCICMKMSTVDWDSYCSQPTAYISARRAYLTSPPSRPSTSPCPRDTSLESPETRRFTQKTIVFDHRYLSAVDCWCKIWDWHLFVNPLLTVAEAVTCAHRDVFVVGLSFSTTFLTPVTIMCTTSQDMYIQHHSSHQHVHYTALRHTETVPELLIITQRQPLVGSWLQVTRIQP